MAPNPPPGWFLPPERAISQADLFPARPKANPWAAISNAFPAKSQTILLREGIDYVQTKAVFKAARAKAGLKAPKERRTAPARLTIEEQLRFIDAAYVRDGPGRPHGADPCWKPGRGCRSSLLSGSRMSASASG